MAVRWYLSLAEKQRLLKMWNQRTYSLLKGLIFQDFVRQGLRGACGSCFQLQVFAAEVECNLPWVAYCVLVPEQRKDVVDIGGQPVVVSNMQEDNSKPQLRLGYNNHRQDWHFDELVLHQAYLVDHSTGPRS